MNGVAGGMKEACTVASKGRGEELQESSCQAGWATGVAFPVPGRGSARGQRGGHCGIARGAQGQEEEEEVRQGEREPNKGGFTNKALRIGA